MASQYGFLLAAMAVTAVAARSIHPTLNEGPLVADFHAPSTEARVKFRYWCVLTRRNLTELATTTNILRRGGNTVQASRCRCQSQHPPE